MTRRNLRRTARLALGASVAFVVFMVLRTSGSHPGPQPAPSLAHSIEIGDYQSVRSRLAKGSSPDTITGELGMPMPVLGIAVLYGDVRMVRLLLAHGAHPNDVPKGSGSFAIAEACNARDPVEVARALLRNGASVGLVGTMGNPRCPYTTVLHCAVNSPYPNPVLVYLLLTHGANPAAKDGAGVTVLDSCTSPILKKILLNYSARRLHKTSGLAVSATRRTLVK